MPTVAPAPAPHVTLADAGVDADGPCARLSVVDGVIVRVNAAAERLLDRAPGALLGLKLGACLTPDSLLLWESHLLPLLMVRGTLDGVFLGVLLGSGGDVPMHVAASRRVEGGQLCVELALLLARQRVAYEQELKAARDAAEAARAEVVAAHEALAASTARERESAAQLQQAQKLEAVGMLAGGIAHDFNNLLAVVSGHAESATAQLAALPPSLRCDVLADLEQLQGAVTRAAGVVRQLLAFSRQQVLVPVPLDVGEVIRGAESLLRPTLGTRTAWTVVEDADVGRVMADRAQLEQVLLNLVLNARDAIAESGRPGAVTVRVAPYRDHGETSDPADATGPVWTRLTVTDTGQGMSADTLARACDPFFTTKGVGKGSGLGLAMVHGIVRQSGGRVGIESTAGHGTSVIIDLPVVPGPVTDDAHVSVTTGTSAVSAVASSGYLMLVEDEPSLRRLAARMLEQAGFSVLACEDGDAAWRAWETQRSHIRGVVSDVRMPGCDGHALRRALRQHSRTLPIVLMSGYAEQPVDDLELTDTFLEKPFSLAQLLHALEVVGLHPTTDAVTGLGAGIAQSTHSDAAVGAALSVSGART